MDSNYEAVRREQREIGSRMAREDGAEQIVPRRTLHASKSSSFPKKAKPQGHEAFLKALETSGSEVEVEKKSSGDKLIGTVKHSDKYTITLRQVDAEGNTTNRVLFKHDISEFRALQAAPAAEGVTLQ